MGLHAGGGEGEWQGGLSGGNDTIPTIPTMICYSQNQPENIPSRDVDIQLSLS